MARAILKRLRRWLYLGHRWLGIVTGLLFATWLISGVVMMYVGFPALTDAERRDGLPILTWERVRVSPTQALAAAGQDRFPQDLRLAMLDGEPVYRVVAWDGTRHTVTATDARPIPGIAATEALAVAAHDPRAAQPRLDDSVERDQWSVTARYDPQRPFHLVRLGDDADTVLYVSARTGEIALDTTRTERVWNWLGAIPHWIYLTPLRAQAALWRDVVLWVSGVSIVTAVTGFAIGLLRIRPWRRYRSGSVTPYRGWQAWHHLAGLVGGVTLISFIVSGWLSVNPNQWFGPRRPTQAMLERYAGTTVPRLDVDPAVLGAGACPDAVEVQFGPLGGSPHAVTRCRSGAIVPCCDRREALDPAHLLTAARRLMPDAALAGSAILTEEDAYWYTHHRARPLPVLRVRFADPEATWFHIDPRTGEILDRLDRSARGYRWLFDGLHTLDFSALIRRRPMWDGLVWLLSAAGLIVATSGVVIGWRRLRSSTFRSGSSHGRPT